MKERVTDVTYKVQKEGSARSRSKVVHFNNLKHLKGSLQPAVGEDNQNTFNEEPNEDDSEHELLTTTIPDTSNAATPTGPPREGGEDLGHCPDSSVDMEEESPILEMLDGELSDRQPSQCDESDSDEDEVIGPSTDEITLSQRPARERKPPNWYGDYVVNLLNAAKKTVDSLKNDC